MKFEAPYYWSVDSGNKEGPFCQPCWDEKQISARLYTRTQGSWTCLVCSKTVRDSTYEDPPTQPRRQSTWIRDRY